MLPPDGQLGWWHDTSGANDKFFNLFVSESPASLRKWLTSTPNSIPNMAGIIQAPDDSPVEDDGHIGRLRYSALHNFVQCRNAQLFGNPAMKTVLQVGDTVN